MATVKPIATGRRRDGKPVRKYKVIWREPMRDEYGVKRPNKYHTRSRTFDLASDAYAHADLVEAARHTGTTRALTEQRKAGELPLGHYAREWLNTIEIRVSQGRLKRDTAKEYGRLLHGYVLPELGATAVASITPARCEQFLAALTRRQSRQGNREPLSPATVTHAYSTLRRVLKYAKNHGAISEVPTETIEFGSGGIGDREDFAPNPLTLPQVRALCAAISGQAPDEYVGPALPAYPVYGLMVEFMALTGLRAAEVSGLEVGDIEFAPSPDPNAVRGFVRVTRAKRRRDGKWASGTLKTKNSRRTVPLEPALAARMADYLAEVHKRADEPGAPLWPSRKNGGGYRARGERYAVPFDWSQPLALGAFYDTIMKPALEAVGLPASRPATPTTPAVQGVRVHDLRHTAACLWLTGADGRTAQVHYLRVAQLLGHGSPVITLKTYSRWIEDDTTAPAPLPPMPADEGETVVPFRRGRQQTG